MTMAMYFLAGLGVFAVIRVLVTGFYTVPPDQRAVLTSFCRADRLSIDEPPDPPMSEEEHERYRYPAVRVIGPGGPYFKWPWQQVHKVSVATQAVDLAWDPTKDQSTVEAKSTRPVVVGRALNEIAEEDPEILTAVLQVLEAEELLSARPTVDVLPGGANVLIQLGSDAPPTPVRPGRAQPQTD